MGIAIIVPDVDFSESNLGKVKLAKDYEDIISMYPQIEEYLEGDILAEDVNVEITSTDFYKTLAEGVSATDTAVYLDVTLDNYTMLGENRYIMGIDGISTPRVNSTTYSINLTNSIALTADGRNKTLKFLLIYKNGTVSAYLDGVKIDDYTLATAISGAVCIGHPTSKSMPNAIINRIIVAKKA